MGICRIDGQAFRDLEFALTLGELVVILILTEEYPKCERFENLNSPANELKIVPRIQSEYYTGDKRNGPI
jgi:hypothetical protein